MGCPLITSSQAVRRRSRGAAAVPSRPNRHPRETRDRGVDRNGHRLLRSDITPTICPNKETTRAAKQAAPERRSGPFHGRRLSQLSRAAGRVLRRRRSDLGRERRRAESEHAEREQPRHPRRVARRADRAANPSLFWAGTARYEHDRARSSEQFTAKPARFDGSAEAPPFTLRLPGIPLPDR
jgi:hypothetical protein